MSTETSTSLRVSRVFNAVPDVVFRAWTEPTQLRPWSCLEGAMVADCLTRLARMFD